MSKEFRLQRLPLNNTKRAQEDLNVLSADGWDILYAFQSNQDIVAILHREPEAPLISEQLEERKKKKAKRAKAKSDAPAEE